MNAGDSTGNWVVSCEALASDWFSILPEGAKGGQFSKQVDDTQTSAIRLMGQVPTEGTGTTYWVQACTALTNELVAFEET